MLWRMSSRRVKQTVSNYWPLLHLWIELWVHFFLFVIKQDGSKHGFSPPIMLDFVLINLYVYSQNGESEAKHPQSASNSSTLLCYLFLIKDASVWHGKKTGIRICLQTCILYNWQITCITFQHFKKAVNLKIHIIAIFESLTFSNSQPTSKRHPRKVTYRLKSNSPRRLLNNDTGGLNKQPLESGQILNKLWKNS